MYVTWWFASSVGCFMPWQHLSLSWRVPTCGSAHSWWLYSAAPLGNQAACTITQYPTQLHYPNIELTNPFPVLLIPSATLGSDKYQFDVIGLTWPGTEFWISCTQGKRSTDLATTPGTSGRHLQCWCIGRVFKVRKVFYLTTRLEHIDFQIIEYSFW